MMDPVIYVTLAEAVLLLIFVVFLVTKHASLWTPKYVKGLTIVAWFLGFTVILVVPADIYIVRHPIQ